MLRVFGGDVPEYRRRHFVKGAQYPDGLVCFFALVVDAQKVLLTVGEGEFYLLGDRSGVSASDMIAASCVLDGGLARICASGAAHSLALTESFLRPSLVICHSAQRDHL